MASEPAGAGDPAQITLFECGPKRCEHDYSLWGEIIIEGRVVGGTAFCSKCGASAYDEAQWA
jgi:hypothetical protein